MNETGQSGVVADDHTPPPSDLTFREALEQLRAAIERVIPLIPKE